MLTKFVVAFSILALAAAFAGGSVPVKGPVYGLVLTENALVNGTALKAGEYRIQITPEKVIFSIGKVSHEFAAKVETAEKKFENNQVLYNKQGDQNTVKHICLGGSKFKLLFN